MRPGDLDVRAIAEVLADVLVERGLVGATSRNSGRVLDASGVAELLGRERQWVYDHAKELGAFRYGDGPRARLGFDLNAVERWKRERQERGAKTPTHRRRPASKAGHAGAAALIPYEGSGRGA